MFQLLPSDIKENILQHYWQSKHFDSVSFIFQENERKLNKYITFIMRHVITGSPSYYFKQILPYLLEINNYFQNISQDKAIMLYLKARYIHRFNVEYVCNGLYATSLYDRIHPQLRMVAKCSILLSPTMLTLHLVGEFTKLSEMKLFDNINM